ncbi:MAG: hypothetical protein ACMUJM_03900 [bacterium]
MNKTKKQYAMTVVIFFTLVLFFSGCGGDSGSGGSTGLTYAGIETQVLIDANNADEVVENAYINTNMARNTADTIYLNPNSTDYSEILGRHRPVSIALARTTNHFINQTEIPNASQQLSYRALVQESEGTEIGVCGGESSYHLVIDNTKGTFSLSATFDNYCANEGVLINGTMSMRGQFNMQTASMNNSVSFTNLQVILEESNTSITTTGTMAIVTEFMTFSCTMTMNMIMQDNLTEKTYCVDNFVLTMPPSSTTQLTFTLEGRFYDYDYGYCDISTETPFSISVDGSEPTSGTLVISGANGSGGGNTSAKLIIDSNSYEVQADTNGDGTYDYESGSLTW